MKLGLHLRLKKPSPKIKTIHNTVGSLTRRWLQEPASIHCLTVTTWANNSPANLAGSLDKSTHNTSNQTGLEQGALFTLKRSVLQTSKAFLSDDLVRPEDEATEEERFLGLSNAAKSGSRGMPCF